ncbi:MAG: hypothetical protein JWL98_141 [Xanthomonadaceae bacterium]|nr:hypothetical protein [Xanthomonadaceae bacterium]
MSPADGEAAGMVDPQNPWLGLFSYSEETLAYFHGRDAETAELARRVQRKLLTVLFGQSGLGKTSLLRAGIVPRLRAEGYCPVYVRIDYAPDSPSPSEQIKQAIFKATEAAGHWTRPGAAIEGESLWEFLHHRGDLLRDADGRPLIPLLIFDQFEEIFTLAQADDAGRIRANQFLEDLADLVENRPPATLEARIENDDSAAGDFDFARADYRVLIALREDYLAHLESVKASMPSITQNRMRLARMNGAQALSAVIVPGGRLVSREVAESIVRFVAGGSELANAEIEPALLSLVCRELNTVRQAQGRSEISADLLAGSRDTILTEFYERALADQPEGVRRVIEDELLTDSGYRESLAEERLVKALAAAGAAPDSLAKLVDRRLLRIEERLDMRRVELTHDVLAGVVLASRNLRQEREARDAAQQQLAAQREREAATHRALVRARTIAGVCAVLALISVASAIFGLSSMRRANVAEAEAQKSRSDAEKLVGFLIEDFYAELEPTGRLDTLGKLAHKTVGYYDGLPAGLVTPKTDTYRAMALIREGEAQNGSGDLDGARRNLTRARAIFEKLHARGDHGDAVTIGLALAYYDLGTGGVGNASRSDAELLGKAADLLRPLTRAPAGSRQAKLIYANTLNYLSHTQPDKAMGVATCEEARRVLKALGALDLTDLNAAAAYADIADSEARHLLDLDRVAEAQTLEQQVFDLAEKVLAQRPNDLRSLGNRYYAAQLLGDLAARRHDDAAAADYANRAAQAGEDLVRFNPADLASWLFWAGGKGQSADLLVERGQVTQAMAAMRATLALAQDKRRPSSLAPVVWSRWALLAMLQARAGEKAAAEQSMRSYVRDVIEFMATFPAGSPRRQILGNSEQIVRARLQLIEGDSEAALRNATAAMDRIDKVVIPAKDLGASLNRDSYLRASVRTASWAALRLGRHAQAESLARRWLAMPFDPNSNADPRDESSRARAVLAQALAMQSRSAEARATLQPALDYYQHEQQLGAQTTSFRYGYAYALYVSSLTSGGEPAKRRAALATAATLISGASAEARTLSDMREVSGLIAAARGSTRG